MFTFIMSESAFNCCLFGQKGKEANMRRISGLAPITTFFVLLAMLLTACGGSSTTSGGGTTPTAAPAAKVALVTDIGGLNDRSFNQLAYGGYTQAQKQYAFTP